MATNTSPSVFDRLFSTAICSWLKRMAIFCGYLEIESPYCIIILYRQMVKHIVLYRVFQKKMGGGGETLFKCLYIPENSFYATIGNCLWIRTTDFVESSRILVRS